LYTESKRENFCLAVNRLAEMCARYPSNDEAVRDSVIRRFEFTVELAHKAIRELLLFKGMSVNKLDILRTAYSANLINDEEIWLDMIDAGNRTSHEYDEEIAKEYAGRIKNEFLPILLNLQEILKN
jgi:nucleotidyltransferase substrate binding protein (TIGR01987 family)